VEADTVEFKLTKNINQLEFIKLDLSNVTTIIVYPRNPILKLSPGNADTHLNPTTGPYPSWAIR